MEPRNLRGFLHEILCENSSTTINPAGRSQISSNRPQIYLSAHKSLPTAHKFI